MRIWLLLSSLLALTGAVSDGAPAAEPMGSLASSAGRPPATTVGFWQPARGLKQMRTWPGNAPDGTFRPQPPESVETYNNADAVSGTSQAVLNNRLDIDQPSRWHGFGATILLAGRNIDCIHSITRVSPFGLFRRARFLTRYRRQNSAKHFAVAARCCCVDQRTPAMTMEAVITVPEQL